MVSIKALYYCEDHDEVSYAILEKLDKKNIDMYLDESDGKALPFKNKDRSYWVLSSTVNRNTLMFRKVDDEIPYRSISEDEVDITFFEYLLCL